jgi:hypothetical protein
MAELNLRDVTREQFEAFQRKAIETSERFTAEGKPVRLIRSTWVPSESRAMCLFEAANAKLVQEVNETANTPFTRIVEAVELASS